MAKLSDFDFDLPNELIAREPALERDASRLLVYERASGAITISRFREIGGFLDPGDTLVVNSTRVYKARLIFRRGSGGSIETLLTRSVDGKGLFSALIKPLARLRAGEPLYIDGIESARFEGRAPNDPDQGALRFDSEEAAYRLAEKYGRAPLPGYILKARDGARPSVDDEERYQTIFADEPASSAAPTAGLHFTDRLVRRLKSQSIKIAPINATLGFGSFRPIRSESIEEHSIDPERYSISRSSADTINATRALKARVVAVGSSCARALESAYGRAENLLEAGNGESSLYIRPGFEFRAIDAMVTNFHLPKSSLFILIAALVGREEALRIYQRAIAERFRFYSYGDATLIL